MFNSLAIIRQIPITPPSIKLFGKRNTLIDNAAKKAPNAIPIKLKTYFESDLGMISVFVMC